MSILSKTKKAIKDPSRLLYLLPFNEFSGSVENRSESDNGNYLSVVRGALDNYSKFSNFKKHPFYRAILEHVSKEQGERYLEIIKERNPQFLDDTTLTGLRKNDDIGNPIKQTYPHVGEISPTTLRYIKVASDLRVLFGDNLGGHVVEIGCGYGGQMLILDQLFELPRYTMFDVPLVCQLISKYVESYVINGSYGVTTLNKYQPSKVDLVISNYAFSELPKHLQLMYLRKVLSNSSKGYLTMNSGKGGSLDATFEKMSLEELRAALPEFEVIEEDPLTAPFNYIIVWGHKRR